MDRWFRFVYCRYFPIVCKEWPQFWHDVAQRPIAPFKCHRRLWAHNPDFVKLVSWLQTLWSDQVTIFHNSQQLSCRDTCELWPDPLIRIIIKAERIFQLWSYKSFWFLLGSRSPSGFGAKGGCEVSAIPNTIRYVQPIFTNRETQIRVWVWIYTSGVMCHAIAQSCPDLKLVYWRVFMPKSFII